MSFISKSPDALGSHFNPNQPFAHGTTCRGLNHPRALTGKDNNLDVFVVWETIQLLERADLSGVIRTGRADLVHGKPQISPLQS